MTSEETLQSLLNAGEPWGLLSVLAELTRATEHLLRDHDCDTEGHEEFAAAAAAGREILRRFDHVPWPRGESPAPDRALAAMQATLVQVVERSTAHVRPRHMLLSREETMALADAWALHGGNGLAPVLLWDRNALGMLRRPVRVVWVGVDENADSDAVRPDGSPRWLIGPEGGLVGRVLAIWPDGVESWLRGPGSAPAYDPEGTRVTGLDAEVLLSASPGYPWSYSVRRAPGPSSPHEVAVLTVRTGEGDAERERVILSSPDAEPGVMHLASFAPDMAHMVMRLESEARARDALIVAQAQELVAWRLAMDEARRDAPVNVQAPGSEGARLQMALLRARQETAMWRKRAE